MLIPTQYNQKGIFERIIRSRDGQLVRVFFEVYEWNGEIKGRIVRAEPILALTGESQAERASTLSLSAPAVIVSPYFWNIEKKITSPFSNLDFFLPIPDL